MEIKELSRNKEKLAAMIWCILHVLWEFNLQEEEYSDRKNVERKENKVAIAIGRKSIKFGNPGWEIFQDLVIHFYRIRNVECWKMQSSIMFGNIFFFCFFLFFLSLFLESSEWKNSNYKGLRENSAVDDGLYHPNPLH